MAETKKYELIPDDTIWINGRVLHRIRALIDFRIGTEKIVTDGVTVGTLGGYIETEDNLSHLGCAWVGDNARAFGRATVRGNACVKNRAWVYGNACVDDSACVDGNAYIGGGAFVAGNANVGGNAHVRDNAYVDGNARVDGDARIGGNATVHESAYINGSAYIDGNARVSGKACIDGNAHVCGRAHIKSKQDIFVADSIGSRNDATTFYKTADGGIGVTCGCFTGTIDEFAAAVEETHGNNKYGREYQIAIELAKLHILGE